VESTAASVKPQRGPWPGKLAFYIDVDDLDAYSEKIRQAGGKIVVEKMDVHYFPPKLTTVW
jgi:predicted enzyme related to lactoylglutathione lyase